jgi:Acetyltransferase (GNAT) domain
MDCSILNPETPRWLEILDTLDHDIYHLPEYAAIEAERNQAKPEAFLLTSGAKHFFVPYLLRSCSFESATVGKASNFDLISPYGYSGILINDSAQRDPDFLRFAMHEFKDFLDARTICSVFLRLHPILNQQLIDCFPSDQLVLTGETVSVDLSLSESELWAHTRKGHQSTINKCKRSGLTAKMVSYQEYESEFLAIYQETMSRVGAESSYFFDPGYFSRLMCFENQVHLCIVELEQQVISASLFFECCSIVQAHLGGTRSDFLKLSPFSLLLDHVRYWAKSRGNKLLHLGGGASKDQLYTFKSGFSRQRHPFYTLRLIVNEDRYQSLVELQAEAIHVPADVLRQSSFFPAYRAIPQAPRPNLSF